MLLNHTDAHAINARVKKLIHLIETLTPPPAGCLGFDSLAKLATLTHKTSTPIDAEFAADRPVHFILDDIKTNLIDFMGRVHQKESHHMELLQTSHTLASYPMMLTSTFRVMVGSPKVEVACIDGKGMGVIAAADISANTILTFYPADLIRVRHYESSPTVAGGMSSFFTAHKHVRDLGAEAIDEMAGRLDGYKFSISNTDIYGDPKIYTPGCCAHMMNDGNGPVKGNNNAVLVALFGGALIAAVAVFDVKAGTEIMAPYGDGYW